MKKRILIKVIVCLSFVAVAVAAVWGIRIYLRKKDSNWKIAKELYRVETALQEIDEEWKLDSLSKVTPFHYQNPDGSVISYYCCTTTYVGDEPTEYPGLHKTALDMVVDLDALENRRDCEVNGLEAVMGELDEKTYLCWTISPKYSCVIEYASGTIKEADIFRMAASIAKIDEQ